MLGSGYINSKSNNTQRQRIQIDSSNELNKKLKRTIFIKNLIYKYFNKICDQIIKDIYKGKNKTLFYFNYYDFINEKMGHPQLIMNEILYEMTYEFSEYVNKDEHNNIITLKTLFGNNFKFNLKGKNLMIFEW